MPEEIKDYTRNPEGRYAVEVMGHEVGEYEGDIIFRLSVEPRERYRADGSAEPYLRASARCPTIQFTLNTAKFWLFKKLLVALGAAGLESGQILNDDGSMFKGKVLDLECVHSLNKKKDARNEYWNLPRDGGGVPLKKLDGSKVDRLAQLFTAAEDAPETNAHGVEMDGSYVPF